MLFEELYKRSFSYSCLYSFIIDIPEYIEIVREGLKFSTIHAAKGLEAKVVIYIKLPSKIYNENLEYVAATRAKDELHVIQII